MKNNKLNSALFFLLLAAHCEITNNQILVDENVAIHDSETEDNDDDQSATTSSCSENHDDFTKNLNKNCQLTLPSSHSELKFKKSPLL